MNIVLITVGKLKEKYWKDAASEYLKRISRFAKITIIEVEDEKAPDNLSLLQTKQIKDKEGEKVLKKIEKKGHIVTLVIEGKGITSEMFADFIYDKSLRGVNYIYFIVGGSLGLSDEVLKRSHTKLSFSKMTFPHQMTRIILLEQIFRAYKINNNQPYHK